MIGQTLSHYRILEKLGEGGMGVLYRALDTRLDRNLAIKVLQPDAVGDADRRRRFVQEAKAASALNHPHIVTVYDIGQAHVDGAEVDFIAMECVEGEALDRVMAGRRLAMTEALDFAVQIADALGAAHAAGIVHRDVKPANVMVVPSGHVKVLDFGLAKLTERASSSDAVPTVTAGRDSPTDSLPPLTRQGALVGTPAYMSPEQADDKPADARSDVFALGAVIYEMLAGRRPFQGDSYVSTLTAILRDAPPSLKSVRPVVPRELERIVLRCLAKDRSARYASAGELLQDLTACRDRLLAAASSPWRGLREPRFAVPLAASMLVVVALAAWIWVREARVRWARNVALPEIVRLTEKEDYYQAFKLARQAEPYLPGEPQLLRFWTDHCIVVPVHTTPPGAEVFIKPYLDVDGSWEFVGRTPIDGVRIPLGNPRWRIAKEGFEPVEMALDLAPALEVTLDTKGTAPSEMVRVSGGPHEFRAVPRVELADFWLDRYEVTNRQFKQFVDRGGYRSRGHWKQPFVKDGRTLTWEEAMPSFQDSTGRPGPASWDLGTYPQGQADHPVGGVSWFEAAAYAEFAGKSLPTFHHWYRAAGGMGLFSEILLLSNFGGKAAAPAGSYKGLAPFGNYDMAGNVKEWCSTAVGAKRYLLGGGWDEANYMFIEQDARSPWDRLSTYGFRCARYSAPLPPGQSAPVDRVSRDYTIEKPVSDEIFRVYKSLYAYDRKELKPSVEAIEEAEHWRREKLSFDAAYGDERVPAHLFLPRNAAPPYQTVVFFPSGEAAWLRSSDNIRMRDLDFIIRSGRAVMHPIYKGTYERLSKARGVGPGERRDRRIQIAKDLGRSIDYLETRSDIDRGRLAYCGMSWGANMGALLLGVETRFKAAVLHSGGFPQTQLLPEADAINFAPRITIPILMLNGRYDFDQPYETTQKPLFMLLGTPAKDKRHVLYETGHISERSQGQIKEILDWLERYLGPVEASP